MSDPFDLSQHAKKSEQPGEEPPRIIVDSDWKAQAQAEKEKLASQESAAGAAGQEQDDTGMPPADFKTLMASLATQGLLYLGGIPDPETGRGVISLEYARHYIDLLAVLEVKTKGNLDKDEAEELAGVLKELRARFVYIAQSVAAQQAQGADPGTSANPGTQQQPPFPP
ncbi:MAG: DUF1844 domain-containing protein [Phycisphaeraceae bacterium]|nr:MAG: DUF1844 domain-containing protein [Phycisphaeraceae bacterium]